MKSDILKLKPDFPDEFVYQYNKTSLEVMKENFKIDTITEDVCVVSNKEISFFVVYDSVDKRWCSSIECELNFSKEKLEEISSDSLHKFIALNCIHSTLTSATRKLVGRKTKEILDRLLNND